MKNDVTYYDAAYMKCSKKIGALLTADDTPYQRALEEDLNHTFERITDRPLNIKQGKFSATSPRPLKIET